MSIIKSILVVCLGNICRSPYGEIKLKELIKLQAKEVVKVSSAGIYAMVGEFANIHSIKIGKERGLDLSNHIAKQLTIELLKEYDLILVMDLDQKIIIEKKYPFSFGKVHSIGKWRNEEVHDPYGKPYPAFINMADHIDECLNDWLLKIK
jgi:protein-tyrosine phosphatase